MPKSCGKSPDDSVCLGFHIFLNDLNDLHMVLNLKAEVELGAPDPPRLGPFPSKPGMATVTSVVPVAVPVPAATVVALAAPVRKKGNCEDRLRRAVIHDDLPGLLECLQNGAANGKDKAGKTPLHHGGRCGRLEVMRVLLQHGFNANVADQSGLTPVDEAEYWAMKCDTAAERHVRLQCRNLLASHGGRRGSSKLMQGYYESLARLCGRDGRDFSLPWSDQLEHELPRLMEFSEQPVPEPARRRYVPPPPVRPLDPQHICWDL